jgi:hypothetical protein
VALAIIARVALVKTVDGEGEMMLQFADVASQAMGLPRDQRADLAHQLIVSLDEARNKAGESLEDLLVARQERVQSGDFSVFEASETLDHMRQSLRNRSEP